MDTDYLRRREVIDLADRARDLRDNLIPDLEERIEAAESQADRARDDEDADPPEHTPGELRNLRDRLKGQAIDFDRTIKALCPAHEFDPTVHDDHPCHGVECEHAETAFTIEDLLTDKSAMLEDDVGEKAVEIDLNTQQGKASPKEGYHKTRTLELAIVDAPAELGTHTDQKTGGEAYNVGDLPENVSTYLYECATALMDLGEVDGVGNLQHYGVSSTSTT